MHHAAKRKEKPRYLQQQAHASLFRMCVDDCTDNTLFCSGQWVESSDGTVTWKVKAWKQLIRRFSTHYADDTVTWKRIFTWMESVQIIQLQVTLEKLPENRVRENRDNNEQPPPVETFRLKSLTYDTVLKAEIQTS